MAVDDNLGSAPTGPDTLTAAWNGTPTVLLTKQNMFMPQTSNATTVLAATNQSTTNSQGQLALTCGGAAPMFVDVPALANQPSIVINNWGANRLGVANISVGDITPVLVQAVGPATPGIAPQPLTVGANVPLGFGQCAQGTANPCSASCRPTLRRSPSSRSSAAPLTRAATTPTSSP